MFLIKDVFEILGISNKEDCFTNLTETFNESGSREFRNQFCRAISNNKTNIYDSADEKFIQEMSLMWNQQMKMVEEVKLCQTFYLWHLAKM